MKNELALGLIVIAFASGYFVGRGRKFPPHNYAVVSSEGRDIVLVDTVTGKVCSPTNNLLQQQMMNDLLRSPDAADPTKLKDALQKQSEAFEGMERGLGPRCPE